MYQVNKKTGDLKQSATLSKGYTEVSSEYYEDLKELNLESRRNHLNEDGNFDNLTAKNIKISKEGSDKSFTSDGETNATNSSYLGVHNDGVTATKTFELNAEKGSGSFSGQLDSDTLVVKNKASGKSQKGNVSEFATLEDLAGSTADIKSPKDTIAVTYNGKTINLDAKLATAVKAGIALFPIGSGLTINEKGEVYLDGAIAPFKYIDLWNAATNTPTLSDVTGKPETFYIVHVRGSQNLGSGSITFEVGDWVLCQEDIGGKPKYAKVPMSEVLGAITASMIKAGTLGKGIAMDTDQPIKTSAGMEADTIKANTVTFNTVIITGSLIGQK